MNYELAKELKEAGFPQPFLDKKGIAHGALLYPGNPYAYGMEDKQVYAPTLEELIEACGERFGTLERTSIGVFGAYKKGDMMVNGVGSTPTEAVARLWLALNRSSTEE